MMKILVVVEAEADFRVASVLADRVFSERAEHWIADNLDAFREWCGLLQQTSFLCWKDIRRAEEQILPSKPRMLGHLDGQPLRSDGILARRLMQLAQLEQSKEPSLQGVLFVRDLDTHDQVAKRRDALERVREAFAGTFQIVLGLADPKREAWVLNGFVPEDDTEEKKKIDLRASLGFDPCLDAHRLRTSSHSNLKEQHRNVKNVLEHLTEGNFSREERCWTETPLEYLEQHGEETGLSAYLAEVLERFVPSLGS